MLDRVRIRTLRDAGHTLEEIAATVGVGKSSVQGILKPPPSPARNRPRRRSPGALAVRVLSKPIRIRWSAS